MLAESNTYYSRNREEYHKIYYSRNRERLIEYQRQYYQNNHVQQKPRMKKYNKIYYIENSNKRKEYSKNYYRKNKYNILSKHQRTKPECYEKEATSLIMTFE